MHEEPAPAPIFFNRRQLSVNALWHSHAICLSASTDRMSIVSSSTLRRIPHNMSQLRQLPASAHACRASPLESRAVPCSSFSPGEPQHVRERRMPRIPAYSSGTNGRGDEHSDQMLNRVVSRSSRTARLPHVCGRAKNCMSHTCAQIKVYTVSAHAG